MRHKVESLLQQQATARHQQQQLHMAQQRHQAAARLAAVRQQELDHARAGLQAQRQRLLARCDGVTQAAGGLMSGTAHEGEHCECHACCMARTALPQQNEQAADGVRLSQMHLQSAEQW